MTAQRPLLLANALLVDPAAGTQVHGGLLVRDGLIADAGPHLAPGAAPEGTETVDCGGRIVAPGLVDMRCFVGEPGYEYRETIASATAAAAAGGVTTLVSQPATDPAVDDPAIVDFLLRRARDTGIVRFHPMAAITKKLAGREMTEFGLLQEAGAVAFTDGARSVTDALVMRRAMTYARDFDALIVHHTEEPSLVGEGVMNEGEFASRLGLAGIPVEAETIMLERDIRLVKLTGARYHAASVTCRDSLAIIARAKNEGLPVTAAVSINHLTLNENDIGSYRTFCKLSPPLRTEDDRLALADAVADGTIDVVVSDHDPQDVETKRLPFAEAAPGAVGVETMLPAALRLVHGGLVPLATLLRALSTAPAQLLRLPGGTLARGEAADLVVIDLDTPWVLDRDDLRSKCKNSPFDEARMSGRVLRTIVGGRTVHAVAG
ncbi:dihydroorotase [Phreatobacter cathodiphilus]|uniref:Dihydroorotase n=1 Tax=Phreatobacter cathodiphilus TaxID=1868589 RepID=A0A2S0NAL8_9HYPH|nr:dihydroorotase [Phreatobacter cathodiphilus]AVO45188.1 dihydroorotase [Phreatobacter cathodiphilus]